MPRPAESACPSEPELKSMPGTRLMSGWSPSGLPMRVYSSSTDCSKKSQSASSG